MRVGLQIPSFTTPGGPASLREQLADVARRAEQAGFSSLWVMDHFFQIDFIGPAEQEMLEGYSTLTYLAAHTQRVTLGTLVTGVTYRQPGILAKTVNTLDVLSGGRAILGIGAAWYEREHRGLGVPFPSQAERFERLEETLQIVKQMWSEDAKPYAGRHYQLAETLAVPAPLQRPHPPILIGGMGEKKTLRLVAQYGDACNLFDFEGPEVVGRKLDVLRRHCDDVGRSYDDIERTTLSTLSPADSGADAVIDRLSKLADVGVQQGIVNLPDLYDGKTLETFGREIIPALTNC
jgi:F420-dependent oxidoreductase-like protein